MDPYRVWLSEIMLQQTQVTVVDGYFRRFLAAFPTVEALAAAPWERVAELWAGLGYYRRARLLHEAAKSMAASGVPNTEEGWRMLPGVGPYTAAAVAAIAQGAPANAVDGNIERVMARLFAVETPLPAAKPVLREKAASLVRAARASDWPQALMDLGATICTPTKPACAICPISFACNASKAGTAATLPRRAPKAERPTQHGVAFLLERQDAVLLVRRPPIGLLGGMLALPSTTWRVEPWSEQQALAHAPAATTWTQVGAVRHVFTHFVLNLGVWRGHGAATGAWTPWRSIESAGLPSVFAKAVRLCVQSDARIARNVSS
jgi:A/G-specific adenine glycosylase